MFSVILKFGLVGIMNSAIDYGIFQLLVFLFHIHSPFGLILANTASSSLAVINSFFWNKKWTFQDRNDKYMKQFIAFILVNAFSISMSDIVVVFLNHIAPLYIMIGVYKIKSIYITKFGAILVTMVCNFIAYRIWVFKDTIYEEKVII